MYGKGHSTQLKKEAYEPAYPFYVVNLIKMYGLKVLGLFLNSGF